jgi:hypothetical protein
MFRTSKRYFSSLTFQNSKEDRIKAFGADFHHVWLRDNCQCSACVHPTNKQKLHSSAQFSSTIKPLHVQLSSNDLRVEWPDGHKSRFSAEWLGKNNYNINALPLISYKTWDREIMTHERRTVSFEEFQTSKGYRIILQQLRDFGLAFLSRVPTEDKSSVERVAEKFGVIRVSNIFNTRIHSMEHLGM